jgi:hypothetical protein
VIGDSIPAMPEELSTHRAIALPVIHREEFELAVGGFPEIAGIFRIHNTSL